MLKFENPVWEMVKNPPIRRNTMYSVVCSVWCVVCDVWSGGVECGVWSVECRVQSAVCSVQCAVCRVQWCGAGAGVVCVVSVSMVCTVCTVSDQTCGLLWWRSGTTFSKRILKSVTDVSESGVRRKRGLVCALRRSEIYGWKNDRSNKERKTLTSHTTIAHVIIPMITTQSPIEESQTDTSVTTDTPDETTSTHSERPRESLSTSSPEYSRNLPNHPQDSIPQSFSPPFFHHSCFHPL